MYSAPSLSEHPQFSVLYNLKTNQLFPPKCWHDIFYLIWHLPCPQAFTETSLCPSNIPVLYNQLIHTDTTWSLIQIINGWGERLGPQPQSLCNPTSYGLLIQKRPGYFSGFFFANPQWYITLVPYTWILFNNFRCGIYLKIISKSTDFSVSILPVTSSRNLEQNFQTSFYFHRSMVTMFRPLGT